MAAMWLCILVATIVRGSRVIALHTSLKEGLIERKGLPMAANLLVNFSADADSLDVGAVASSVALASDPTRDENASPNHLKHNHTVEHIELLGQENFWWLMFVVVLCMGVAVTTMEIRDAVSAQEGDAPPARYGPRPQRAAEVQETGSSGAVLHLCMTAFMLNTSMIMLGIAQEFVMTTKYVGAGGDAHAFPSATFVVLCNRAITAIFTGGIMTLRGDELWFPGFTACGPAALTNCCASWCQYTSLHHISFGLQTATKSAKLLPVMVLSSLRGKKHALLDYAEMVVVISALFVFGMESDGKAEPKSTTGHGVMYLGVFLLLDSATPHLQDAVFKSYPATEALRSTFAMSCFGSVALFVGQMLLGELIPCLHFLSANPSAILHLVVLSFASTVTQYMISYTIKHFGPVTFTFISCTRQVLSVTVSTILFQHTMEDLEIVAGVIIVGIMLVRSVRLGLREQPRELANDNEDANLFFGNWEEKLSGYMPVLLCGMGIHVFYCIYALSQEFLSTHSFHQELFNAPVLNVAVNHTFASVLAVCALRWRSVPIQPSQLLYTLAPATTSFLATTLQHRALYVLVFPAQTLMKSLRILPVMCAGTWLKNRSYNRVDWSEGILITCVVAYFVLDYALGTGHSGDVNSMSTTFSGVVMMLAYVIIDPFTCNFEDLAYQRINMEPGQMLLGVESASAFCAW
eukprot:CAMPEP_0117618720 /NCGR_PEP_ID=MMETSP0784-20121206/86246_1 /TAXON_ID=39447 /ORGANISM="" /LENGTH=689 /DNA_ID=CAMNT_0005422587 /DNA_START=40 /DNA_END=2106 /DNA_ORIENTATION=+